MQYTGGSAPQQGMSSTLGDITEYTTGCCLLHRGYHEYVHPGVLSTVGGYHEYTGGYHDECGDIMNTAGVVQYTGGIL